jgi:hypothetical protein
LKKPPRSKALTASQFMAIAAAGVAQCKGDEPLAAATPKEIKDIDLKRYRALRAPWDDWGHTVARGRHWAQVIAQVVLEGQL